MVQGSKNWHWGTARGRSIRVLFHVLSQTGFRKAEVALAAGEKFDALHLSLANLTWRIGGKMIIEPTTADLLRLKPGDFAVIWPPPSKADPFGLKWGNYPIWLPYDEDASINAARELRSWEMYIRQPTREARRQLPMFWSDDKGSPLRQNDLANIFQRLLRWVLIGRGKDEASVADYSVHSFRIYLCASLMAAGATDAEIQAALRWASVEALRIYEVRNAEHYGNLIRRAEATRLTGMRFVSLQRRQPQHDHVDAAVALESARADLLVQARRSDDIVAAGGVDAATPDAANDWDAESSFSPNDRGEKEK